MGGPMDDAFGLPVDWADLLGSSSCPGALTMAAINTSDHEDKCCDITDSAHLLTFLRNQFEHSAEGLNDRRYSSEKWTPAAEKSLGKFMSWDFLCSDRGRSRDPVAHMAYWNGLFPNLLPRAVAFARRFAGTRSLHWLALDYSTPSHLVNGPPAPSDARRRENLMDFTLPDKRPADGVVGDKHYRFLDVDPAHVDVAFLRNMRKYANRLDPPVTLSVKIMPDGPTRQMALECAVGKPAKPMKGEAALKLLCKSVVDTIARDIKQHADPKKALTQTLVTNTKARALAPIKVAAAAAPRRR